MGIMSGEDKLFCRAWIWIHLQVTPQPLGPAGVCHCSVLTQRTESCLQWQTGRKKTKWKGKKHLSQTSSHLGGHMGDDLGEHHTSAMHGREGSRHVGRSSANSCWWPGWQPTKLAKPHPALAPGRARKSSSYLLDSHPTGSSIPTHPHSASVSTIAQHKKKGSWAWLHSLRLPCTFEIKNCFY